MTRISLMICGLLLVISAGCNVVSNSMRGSDKISGWNPIDAIKPDSDESGEPGAPETMAAIWNFGVFEKPGSPSVRGLGGRIYFYDADSNAVPAHGELVVYGFDEDSGSKSQPDKKFVFRDTEFQSHFSESPLGGSYSVWVPWDKVGGYRKSVTLIPVFKVDDGRVLRSGQSINLLAGKSKEKRRIDSDEPYRVLGASSAVLGAPKRKAAGGSSSRVTRASFAESGDSGDENLNGDFRQRIRTTEIPLTPNLRRQIEISERVRAGEKVFPGTPGSAVTAGGQANTRVTPLATSDSPATDNNSAAPSDATPRVSPPRTSTSSGVFGAPGAWR